MIALQLWPRWTEMALDCGEPVDGSFAASKADRGLHELNSAAEPFEQLWTCSFEVGQFWLSDALQRSSMKLNCRCICCNFDLVMLRNSYAGLVICRKKTKYDALRKYRNVKGRSWYSIIDIHMSCIPHMLTMIVLCKVWLGVLVDLIQTFVWLKLWQLEGTETYCEHLHL